MRILVTGTAGFVGSRLVTELHRLGHTVIGVDRREPAPAPERIRADLRDLSPSTLPPFQLCFHLASDVGGFLHNAEAEDLVDHELALMHAVQAICRHAGCSRLIYTSSIAVFETGAPPEDAPLRRFDQRTPYARAKAQAELVATRAFEQLVIVRPTNIFGPDQPRAGERPGTSHVIPDLLHKIRSDSHLEVLGDGRQTRNFIHVDDVVRFLLTVMNSAASGCFNLRSNVQLTIGALAEELLRFTGQHREITYRPDYLRYEPAPLPVFPMTAAHALGWRPRVHTLVEGLRRRASGREIAVPADAPAQRGA